MIRVCLYTLLLFLSVFLLDPNLISIQICQGSSMNPTFKNGDLVFFHRTNRSLQAGDLVNFEDHEGEWVVKRVIATGGMSFELRDNNVIIDKSPLAKERLYETERYTCYREKNGHTEYLIFQIKNEHLKECCHQTFVPDGYVFVMGDNRHESDDSRHYGLVASHKLIPVKPTRLLNLGFFL